MPDWPSTSGLPISEHQREELDAALEQRIGCLTGGPGTGKSTVMGALAGRLENAAFVAPTGRAAVRLQETMAERGLEATCSTIHRLLSPQRNGHDGDGWGFHYTRFNKLPFKYIVCDESSMCDSYITRCLLEACDRDTHVLLVGDPDQLPPVGKGKPFLDMIQSGQVPHGHFRETHRFAGRIATVCKAINRGEPWDGSEKIDLEAEYPENFMHVETRRISDTTGLLVKLMRERFPLRTPNVMQDVQVVVPTNDKGPLSQKELNRLLQDVLNPNGQSVDGIEFRVGDKVVCLKNGNRFTARPCPLEGMVVDTVKDYCANGEIGYVREIGTKGAVVEFEGHGNLSYFSRGEFIDLRLGYALTCHKCQGGQWPFVVPIVDESPGARMVCSRSWWYTAFSRGKKLVCPIGKRSVIDQDCRKVDVMERRTHLIPKLLAGTI